MLVTEKEAKERWCPFARQSDDSHSYNRWGPNFINCIGSECMAWRWQPLMADQPFLDAVKERMDESGENTSKATKFVRANLALYDLPDKPFRGMCGLAGALLK